MAFQDTSTFKEAVEKARKLGATHYTIFSVLNSNQVWENFSYTFYKGSTPLTESEALKINENFVYKEDSIVYHEVGNYGIIMESFQKTNRLCAFVGTRGTTSKTSQLISIAPPYRLQSFNSCK